MKVWEWLVLILLQVIFLISIFHLFLLNCEFRLSRNLPVYSSGHCSFIFMLIYQIHLELILDVQYREVKLVLSFSIWLFSGKNTTCLNYFAHWFKMPFLSFTEFPNALGSISGFLKIIFHRSVYSCASCTVCYL